MNTKLNKWTKSDIEFLKENYLLIGFKECAKKLNRSENSIKIKAIKLKLYSTKWSDDEIYFLKENYINIGLKKCAEKLNRSECSIKSKAMKMQIFSEKWNEKEIDYLKQNYGKITTKEIMQQLNRTYNSITIKANKLGLKTNRNKLFQLKDKKNKFNEDFFKEINILNSYWAGFIAADGNIFKNRISIKLSKKDEEQLIKLKKDINFTGKIYNRINKSNKYEYSILCFYSNKTTNDLKNNFRIVPKKSLNLEPPNIDELDFSLSFICGLLDGDGSIYLNKKKNKIYIKFLGTKNIMEWVKNILSNFIKIDYEIWKSGNIYTFGIFSQKNVAIFFNLIKKYNLPLLDRKWQKLNTYNELQ